MLQTLSKRKKTCPINTLIYFRKPMAKFNLTTQICENITKHQEITEQSLIQTSIEHLTAFCTQRYVYQVYHIKLNITLLHY